MLDRFLCLILHCFFVLNYPSQKCHNKINKTKYLNTNDQTICGCHKQKLNGRWEGWVLNIRLLSSKHLSVLMLTFSITTFPARKVRLIPTVMGQEWGTRVNNENNNRKPEIFLLYFTSMMKNAIRKQSHNEWLNYLLSSLGDHVILINVYSSLLCADIILIWNSCVCSISPVGGAEFKLKVKTLQAAYFHCVRNWYVKDLFSMCWNKSYMGKQNN